jgi:membrane protease YdiL (CAAX protease family)
VVLLLLVLPDLVAQASSRTLGLAWSELFTLLFPAVVAAAGSNLRTRRYLGLERTRALPVLVGALLGAAGFLAANGVMIAWVALLPREVLAAFPDVARIFEGGLLLQATIAVVAAIVAPVCEEAAFRGFLQRTLARALGPGAAIGLTALLFAVRHLDPVRFPALILLGAIFGWAAWRSGSIWPAVAAHAANNALASGFALLGGAADPASSELPTLGDALEPLLAGGAAVLLLALWYRRLTPSPPPPEDAVALRDPSVPSTRFRVDRVPASLVLTALAGLAALSALALLAPVWDRLAGP